MSHLLGPGDVRALAGQLGIQPSKARGQNFVVDAGTVERIARIAAIGPSSHVLEVGPGLGSLTLALLATGARVTAIEIDAKLAAALPATIEARMPAAADRLSVIHADALKLTELPDDVHDLVANLPYNVAVPVVLSALERFPGIERSLVMVQREVAERLAARPGSRVYGVPSAKARWYGEVSLAGKVGRAVFWPVPRVDSALVRIERRAPAGGEAERRATFAAIDAAFSQRRKTLRSALARWAGSPAAAGEICVRAGVDPTLRGEQLDTSDFAALAASHPDASGLAGAG